MALTGLLRAAPRRSPFRCRSRAALRAGYLAPLDSTGTLRLLWPLTSACFKGSLRLTVAASLASLMLVVDAPRSCLDVRLPVSSLVRRLLQQRLRLELSQVDSLSLTLRAVCGCLSRCCSAHRLPLSCTSALVSDPGGSPIAGHWSRCAHWSPLGRREDNALPRKRHHSSEAILHGPRNDGNPRGKTFAAQFHGFSARCQRLPRCARPAGSLWLAVSASLRLMPASRLTMHDSLPAVWLQTLPRGVLTRWAAI